MNKALIGQPAPAISVSDWVQGEPSSLVECVGQVVLLEVFQVNCPGCFLYSLPQAINLQQRYADQGLRVLGMATAFEDFDKNTLDNLRLLAESGEVIGETRRVLTEQGQLDQGRWPYRIDFPLAMDRLLKAEPAVAEADVESFIEQKLPDFQSQSFTYQQQIRQRVWHYLQSLEFRPVTFERYALQGTPSQILIDKQGVLRASRFGHYAELESDIQRWLAE